MTPYSGSGAGSQHDLHARARDIRAGLPGQLRRARVTTASMMYGPVYSPDEVHRRIARTLPFRFGLLRRARAVPLERSEADIPDDVLVKYDTAAQLDVFSRFLVLTPAYYGWAQGHPWLVAVIDGTERWVVIARWRDEDRPAA